MNGIKQRWHRTPRWARIVGMIFLGLIAAVFFGIFFGYFVMLLWNWLMPELFSLKEITYWQAFGIVFLARLVFGSIGGGHHDEPRPVRDGRRYAYCTDKNVDMGGDWRNWEYYDEWWDKEGQRAFEGYVVNQKEQKANPEGNAGNS